MCEDIKENKISGISGSGAAVKMPTGEKLLFSSSPHIRAGHGVRAIMLLVVLALLPAAAAGVYFFGWNGLRVLLCSIFFTLAAEMIWCRFCGKPVSVVLDGSALVTGLLLGMNLPPAVPWWVCLLAAVLAIWLGKQVFGGLGHNLFNPVIVARVALLIALPGIMTTWSDPDGNWKLKTEATYAKTGATPLTEAQMLQDMEGMAKWDQIASADRLEDYFWGRQAGCVGETSALALLIGGIFLVGCGVIKWTIPLAFTGTVAFITFLVNHFAPEITPPALFHILTGGLMLGAFFMATDMVTSPMTLLGGIVFGVGCGIITAVIRICGNYPEGVSFSILFMNAAVPLIDKICTLRPFGFVKPKRAKGM